MSPEGDGLTQVDLMVGGPIPLPPPTAQHARPCAVLLAGTCVKDRVQSILLGEHLDVPMLPPTAQHACAHAVPLTGGECIALKFKT